MFSLSFLPLYLIQIDSSLILSECNGLINIISPSKCFAHYSLIFIYAQRVKIFYIVIIY